MIRPGSPILVIVMLVIFAVALFIWLNAESECDGVLVRGVIGYACVAEPDGQR